MKYVIKSDEDTYFMDVMALFILVTEDIDEARTYTSIKAANKDIKLLNCKNTDVYYTVEEVK